MRYDVVIIGAGISGLSAAYRLNQRQAQILVIEAQERVGGVMHSETTPDGFVLEHGPNTVLGRDPALWEHFAELGIDTELTSAASQSSRRYVVLNGQLEPIPMSPISFLRSRLLSTSAKLRLLAEPFVPPTRATDESVAGFFARRIGVEPTQRLVDPFISGVYAGDPTTLSVAAAFPTLWNNEQHYGSLLRGMLLRKRKPAHKGVPKPKRRLFNFKRGLATWTQALAHALPPEALWLKSSARSIQPRGSYWELSIERNGQEHVVQTKQIIFALPAYVAARLVDALDPQTAQTLRAIPYPPVSLVHLGYHRRDITHPLDGFGMLAPKAEGRQILGTLWMSSIFPAEAPGMGKAPQDMALTTSFIGGARMSNAAQVDDEALIEAAHTEQIALIGATNKPAMARVIRWQQAIPQYTAGHATRIQALEHAESIWHGLHFLGNYRAGVSVEQCWRNGTALGERLMLPGNTSL